MEEGHTITTEAVDEADGPYVWKVECSCGWTRYVRNAEETQEAIYEHRAALLGA